MSWGTRIKKALLGILILALAHGACAQEVTNLSDWFSNGDFILDLRYRVETVDQDAFGEDALASTLRTQVGFKTARLSGFSFLVEVEDVSAIGNDEYNSTTNSQTNFPLVVDPEDTEVNQAYVEFQRSANRLRLGRQVVTLDNQRFFGDVGFRQNQQSYDALMWMNTVLPSHRFIYGYMDAARRFLSDDNPVGDLDMNSHVFNYKYTFTNENTLTLYAYLIDMEPAVVTGRSHRNLGLRYSGSVGRGIKWLYSLEYTDQAPHADGLDTNDADYIAVEIAPRFRNQWILRGGYEQLSGDGVYGFQTPFGTNHKFNGFADIFAANTPATGLRDTYLKLNGPVYGNQLTVAFHNFKSDVGSIDYGTEIDFVLTRRFLDHYSLGVAFSSYDADQFATDTNKFWIWGTVEF